MNGYHLYGRDEQLACLRKTIERLPASGGALTLIGEPGIGKTALLRAAVHEAHAAGLRVLEATGVEVEAGLPYAGLHQLLRPVLPAAEELPAPQRSALLTALGVADGPSPEIFMVGLATLNLLTDSTIGTSTLVTADDVQWLDNPTRQVLAFVARRINRDPVALIATLRKGYPDPFTGAHTAELEVPRLDNYAARQVLSHSASGLTKPEQAHILREAMGNPLALVELPIAWKTRDTHSAESTPAFLPLTARLEHAFAGRVAELPEPSRDAILIAAIDHSDTLPEILAAGTILSGRKMTIDALDAAVAARLVRVDGMHVRLHHPLVRSAVLQSETLARRLAANAAMAEVLVDEPYRRTWHRAQSTIGTDDLVADELEATHTIAIRRGGVIAAIWALERAAQLSTDSAVRGRRLLLACEHAFGLGQTELVDRLLQAAARTKLSRLDHARMEWIREIFSDGVPGDAARVEQLCDIAEQSADSDDIDLALNLLLGAALRCWWADTGSRARANVVAVAEGLAGVQDDPRWGAVLAVAEPVLSAGAVHDWLALMTPVVHTDANALRLLGMAAHAIGDPIRSIDLLSRAETVLRAEGRLGLLSHTLTMQAVDLLLTGDWNRAAEVIEEARQVAEETNQPIWTRGSLISDAILCGFRGDVERTLTLTAEVEASASRDKLNNLLSFIQLARGMAWISTGQYGLAYEVLLRLFNPEDPGYHQREGFDGVMFFAEAAAHTDHHTEAREVIARLEKTALITPAPLLHTQLLYARPVLAQDDRAEELYLSGLGQDLTRWPLVRAKLELAYGSWLRRQRRVAESRTPLRSAHTTLALIGAANWADQARGELRATGERATVVGPSPLDMLSPQELQIAKLAAEGLSNREIGERLYLSPRTIGSHLYRIFPKLDITSRGQLAACLDSPTRIRTAAPDRVQPLS
ncbi:AAA family ATPase [Nocardia tengchongensis]|uniref:helix-turn-helix transcriptional regulator n=1 Tax=Nocardia tengchongensis TaxID=2055889 RepID=UPI0036CC5108